MESLTQRPVKRISMTINPRRHSNRDDQLFEIIESNIQVYEPLLVSSMELRHLQTSRPVDPTSHLSQKIDFSQPSSPPKFMIKQPNTQTQPTSDFQARSPVKLQPTARSSSPPIQTAFTPKNPILSKSITSPDPPTSHSFSKATDHCFFPSDIPPVSIPTTSSSSSSLPNKQALTRSMPGSVVGYNGPLSAPASPRAATPVRPVSQIERAPLNQRSPTQTPTVVTPASPRNFANIRGTHAPQVPNTGSPLTVNAHPPRSGSTPHPPHPSLFNHQQRSGSTPQPFAPRGNISVKSPSPALTPAPAQPPSRGLQPRGTQPPNTQNEGNRVQIGGQSRGGAQQTPVAVFPVTNQSGTQGVNPIYVKPIGFRPGGSTKDQLS